MGDVGNLLLYGNKWYGSLKPNFYAYTKAYFDAYILLRAKLGDNEPNDYLYYPLLYILFHALELTLKTIHSIWSKQAARTPKKPYRHDLKVLWNEEVKKALLTCKSRFTSGDITLLEKLIIEFDKLGKHYEVFKYPDKKSHVEESRTIGHLIISESEAKKIIGINDKFYEIEDILEDTRKLNLTKISINDLEEIKSWSEVALVDLDYIKSRYPEGYEKIIILLKTHYELEINYEFKLKYLDTTELKKILHMASCIHGLEKKLEAKYSQNIIHSDVYLGQGNVSAEKMQVLAKGAGDLKLENLKKELYNFLKSLDNNSYWELELLLQLGRNDISLIDYYCEHLGGKDISGRISFYNTYCKVRDKNYLRDGLRLLGYTALSRNP